MEDEAASRAYIEQMWAEAMEIYRSGRFKLAFSPAMQRYLKEYQQTKDFKAKARKRYKIEAKNSELKHVYGYERAQSYGLYCMQMQGALAIFASNIKRILKLI